MTGPGQVVYSHSDFQHHQICALKSSIPTPPHPTEAPSNLQLSINSSHIPKVNYFHSSSRRGLRLTGFLSTNGPRRINWHGERDVICLDAGLHPLVLDATLEFSYCHGSRNRNLCVDIRICRFRGGQSPRTVRK